MVWQSLAGLLLLYSFIVFALSTLIWGALIIKMGIPPFQNWLKSMRWTNRVWMIFITLQKTLPFLLIVNLPTFSLVLLAWPLIALYLLYSRYDFYSIIIASSISDSAWICLSYKINIFWLFFLLYSMLWLIWRGDQRRLMRNRSNNSVLFLMLLGLPPLVIFFLKINIWLNASLVIAVILGLRRWAMLILYLMWNNLRFYVQKLVFKSRRGWKWTRFVLASGVVTF